MSAAALALIAGTFFLTRLLTTSHNLEVVRTELNLNEALRLEGSKDFGATRTAIALSPDGTRLVYSAQSQETEAGSPQLYVRYLNRSEATVIPGTEGATWPFFSPDGNWIGFIAGAQLKRTSFDGSLPRLICDVNWWFKGASWGEDGTIVFAHGHSLGLFRVAAEGGTPERLTEPDRASGEQGHVLPHFLPSADALLYTVYRGWPGFDSEIRILWLESGETKTLFENASDARFSASGHLLFVREGKIFAAPFELDQLEVSGIEVPTVENVMHSVNVRGSSELYLAAQYTVSDNGILAYASGGIWPDPETDLVLVDRNGRSESLGFQGAWWPRVSADGGLVAAANIENELYLMDVERRTIDQLATRGGQIRGLAWKTDGLHLTVSFAPAENLLGAITNIPVDGTQAATELLTSERIQWVGAWSTDNRHLAYAPLSPEDTLTDIFVLDTETGTTAPFLQNPAYEEYPVWSPDGKWIAYASGESGSWEVHVRPFPGPGGRHRVSTDGGREPIWSGDGKFLYYRSGINFERAEATKMMVVDVSTEPEFHVGPPRVLFEGLWALGFGTRNYDLTRDEQRFLMVERED
jgi:serine/threonine-protein kinase